MSIDHLCQHRPCGTCPFRKDTKYELGGVAAKTMATSFVCHNQREKQCAGHMIVNGLENDFVQLAERLGVQLELKGRELLFENSKDFFDHRDPENLRRFSMNTLVNSPILTMIATESIINQ
jgi:hypothetical protein